MADEEELAASGDFLATATDNRISINADPDRWEGLDDDEETGEDSGATASNMQTLQQPPQQSVRASGEPENESYRMFLTQREQQEQPTLQQHQDEQEQPQEDPEEQFVEQLGSRLVLQPPHNSDRWEAADNAEDETDRFRDSLDPPLSSSARPPVADAPAASSAVETTQAAAAHTVDEGRNFSVRKGGNQLANLLPSQPPQQAPQQPPQPPPPQPPQQPPPVKQQQKSLLRQSEIPAVPKEIHAGYLRLDSGHVLGPFRWSVDQIEAPASLEEGLASSHAGSNKDLFLMLMDNGQARQDGTSRQRFLTRQGRLTFVDSRTGNEIQSNFDADGSTTQRNLQALSRGLTALAGRRGSNAAVDEELTRMLASTLAANGASLMIASSNPIDSPSGQRQGQEQKQPSVNASVVAKPPAKVDQERQELERLVQSLRSEVDALKSENSGLRDRLKSESTPAASLPPLPPSATSSTKPSQQQQQRPASKGSYQSLYEMLQDYMQENESLRTENLGLVKGQGDRLQEQDLLARENRRLAERLQRMQRQQAAQQKPLYVVSNPDSRASSNHQGRPPPPQQQQQQQQQASTAASAVTGTTDTILPPIPLEPQRLQQQLPQLSPGQQQQRKRAFPTPPSQKVRESPPQSLQRQQQQPLQQPPQQPMYYYAPSSDAQQNAAYNNYYAPVYYTPPQPPPVMMQQQQQPQQHPAPAPAQTESPLYVPKPGEATYRGRFRQAAAAGKTEPRRRGAAAQAAPVQDVNRLNESLKSELNQLDGAIQQHQRVNALQSDIRRSQGRKVLKTF